MPLEVHVVTPEREVWSGEAEMVIARGVDGEVGILNGHAPLLIRLAVGPLRIQQEGGSWLKAVVDGGFLHVATEDAATRVDVLASHAELGSDIDVDAARRRLEELAGRDDESAEGEQRKAQARVDLSG